MKAAEAGRKLGDDSSGLVNRGGKPRGSPRPVVVFQEPVLWVASLLRNPLGAWIKTG
jgi:hypothetical protein